MGGKVLTILCLKIINSSVTTVVKNSTSLTKPTTGYVTGAGWLLERSFYTEKAWSTNRFTSSLSSRGTCWMSNDSNSSANSVARFHKV